MPSQPEHINPQAQELGESHPFKKDLSERINRGEVVHVQNYDWSRGDVEQAKANQKLFGEIDKKYGPAGVMHSDPFDKKAKEMRPNETLDPRDTLKYQSGIYVTAKAFESAEDPDPEKKLRLV
jgi:hypothetical protein